MKKLLFLLVLVISLGLVTADLADAKGRRGGGKRSRSSSHKVYVAPAPVKKSTTTRNRDQNKLPVFDMDAYCKSRYAKLPYESCMIRERSARASLRNKSSQRIRSCRPRATFASGIGSYDVLEQCVRGR